MKFKFAIGNVVEVPVKFTTNDAGKAKVQTFTLVCTRLDDDELKERLKQDDIPVKDFVTEVATDWKNQRFLLDDDGQPAEFSAEALAALLSFPGLAVLAFTSYLKEQGAKEKN